MQASPYNGIQDLDDLDDEKVQLPPIPLQYVIVTYSNLEQIKQQQNVPELRLRDQRYLCETKLVSAVAIVFFLFFNFQPVFTDPYIFIQDPLRLLLDSFGLFRNFFNLYFSAFFFLVGFCCVCTNQPMKKYRLLIKLFIFSFVIDLISLAYAAIYFASNLDSSEGCNSVKQQNPHLQNQVENCKLSYNVLQLARLDNRSWLYFSLLCSGVIYLFSLISIIYLCCVVKIDKPVPYTKTQQTEN